MLHDEIGFQDGTKGTSNETIISIAVLQRWTFLGDDNLEERIIPGLGYVVIITMVIVNPLRIGLDWTPSMNGLSDLVTKHILSGMILQATPLMNPPQKSRFQFSALLRETNGFHRALIIKAGYFPVPKSLGEVKERKTSKQSCIQFQHIRNGI